MTRTERAKATQDAMAKLLDLLTQIEAPHAVAIDACANLCSQLAIAYPCCTASAGLMLLEIGQKLIDKSMQQAGQTPTAPGSPSLH